MLRVTATRPGDVPALRQQVERAGGRALEADVRFAYRYLADHGIAAGVEIDGTPERTAAGLMHYRDPALKPADEDVSLRVVSLDLETTPDAGRVLAAALVGTDADEVHLVASRDVAGAVSRPAIAVVPRRAHR